MTTATTADTAPRIWVGCLACYNNTRLVGAWFDAIDGDDITLADVYGGAQHVRPGCEELWVMDHENLPLRGECSPHEAAQLARVVEEAHESDREAFLVWALSGDTERCRAHRAPPRIAASYSRCSSVRRGAAATTRAMALLVLLVALLVLLVAAASCGSTGRARRYSLTSLARHRKPLTVSTAGSTPRPCSPVAAQRRTVRSLFAASDATSARVSSY
jgi:hypothetical protein